MTTGPRDQQLRERAARVIPGGLWGHMNVAGFSPDYPQFFERAEGCTLWDVDGNRYIDFMCSWGPVVLGHKHPRVEAAVDRQRSLGDAMDGPAPVLVDLAELFVETLPFADWALFQKNGSDATTACVTIARAGTGRRKILVAKGAYHGAVPWCSPSLAGVTAEDRAHLIHFTYNDLESLEAAAKAAEGDLAGVILSAFKHDYGQDQATIDPAFLARARRICTDADAALIIDDVRAGFRLDLRGSWAPLGVQPDLAAFSKAIANGYPLAAVAGAERFRAAASSSKVFLTGSFWYGAVSMAAAVAAIGTLRDDRVIEHTAAMGQRLRDGLAGLAASHGLGLRQTGPAQMPMVLFDEDPKTVRGLAFCNAALRAGAYFHPRHNMFLSGAHTAADIDRALEAAEVGMKAAAQVSSRQTAAAE
jgi:glutamate-1-semialdehyde 2,1-aminomutase